ncbi:UNVERIFIED_CONTAM: Dram2 [Trichonephila clavipes]
MRSGHVQLSQNDCSYNSATEPGYEGGRRCTPHMMRNNEPCSWYCIAISLNHVEIGFPYISDTGTYVPESCIFSQAINLVSFLLAIFMYVQYKHVEQHYRDHLSSEFTIVLKLNWWALLVGWCGCVGVNITANYQETSVIIVHMCGALMAFGCATLYSWIQTIISHYVCPLLNSVFITRLRVFFSLIQTASFITSILSKSKCCALILH